MSSWSLCKPGQGQLDLPAFPFEALVFDVQTYIVSFFVPTQDLYSLARVSRHISSLAIPALYADVRLLFGLKPPSRNSPADGAFTKRLISAQRTFKARLLSQREHALRIRSLAWQVTSTGACSHLFTEFFPLLENVTRVHLVDAHPTHTCELKETPPDLFPTMRNVKYTGITSLPFAMSILHSPHLLTAISLDLVNPHSVELQLLQWVSKADLSSLRVLSLRALCRQWTEDRETETFTAWRDTLSAVRNTVKEVTLGFRQQASVGRDACFPSVDNFAQLVLPVFWKEAWAQLELVQFEGIAVDGSGGEMARLCAAVPRVDIDPTLLSVQRFWDSEIRDKF